MPTTKSAFKRMRQSEVRRVRNRSRVAALWTWEKKFRSKVATKEFDAASQLLARVISQYDKAAKVGVIHKNKADRKKARLNIFLAAAKAKA